MTNNSANVNIKWENTKVSFAIETKTNEAVEAQIKEMLVDGPSAATYYGAARFYLENDKETKINTIVQDKRTVRFAILPKSEGLYKIVVKHKDKEIETHEFMVEKG
mgnify:CR=1 FL=1